MAGRQVENVDGAPPVDGDLHQPGGILVPEGGAVHSIAEGAKARQPNAVDFDDGIGRQRGGVVEAPAEPEVLQLWAIEDDDPSSMGTFRPNDDGHVEVVMEGTEPEGVVYAVTIEPEGGSDQPTGEPVLGPA